MKHIAPETWVPQGIPGLEEAAWTALREAGSTSVIAGPGAGKTEFLAQRATYLLQTGICSPPSRILAISFKKDAAENLAARVQKRCSSTLASRFESMTFDAFTKSLVDRFSSALPQEWQPTKPYTLIFPTVREIQHFLETRAGNANYEWRRDITRISPSTFESNHLGTEKLSGELREVTTAKEFIIQQWWQEFLLKRPKSEVSFVMLNRLAELLLRTRPEILHSLRLTYPFVFVDEFQDTTYAQYDFLLSAFGGGKTIITVVGDNKQRIMGWAGALPDAFQQFSSDFTARTIPLRSNYRSSPELVRIQQIVANAIDAQSTEAESQRVQTIEGDVAQVWSFPNNITEAQKIASWLAEDIQRRNTSPRDYALLVKQSADRFEEQLAGALSEKGLRLRNEARRIGRITLQDLLVDELVKVSLSIMKVAASRRAPEAWNIASEAIVRLQGIDPEDEVGYQKAEKDLKTFIDRLRIFMQKTTPHPKYAAVIANRIIEFLNTAALMRAYPTYSTGDNLEISSEGFRIHLSDSAAGAPTWVACIDTFEGKDFVPLMTVHKSKGLEYDTIIFVGLDDQTWWSHNRNNPEGVATFFVALSRAKQRIVFTFCSTRGPRDLVGDLYDLLRTAGVPEVAYNVA